MKALEYIASELQSEDVIATFERGSLELEYRFEDLQFSVSDQLATDGYFAVLMEGGRDYETNAPTFEHEFTSRTALGTLNAIKRHAREYINRWAD